MAQAGNREVRQSLHRFGLARDRLSAAVRHTTGLAASELEALEHLEEDGRLTQRELADRLALTSGGTTLLVDRLERAGLVSRLPHPSDRRAVLLQLNRRAAVTAASAPLDRYHAAVASAARRLSAAEREGVAAFLAAAAAAAGEAAAELLAEEDERRSAAGGH